MRPCVALVTRPQPQADEWVARLQALGRPALAAPLLVIEPVPAFAEAVRAAWASLATRRLVMFVSPNAVLQFFAAAAPSSVWPAGTWAAATGPGTVAALRAQGVDAASIVAPDANAEQFDAETLWRQRLASIDWTGARALIVRGEAGRDWLAETLRAHGAAVECLAAYRRAGPAWQGPLQAVLDRALADPAGHVWLFSSSEAVRHLAAHRPPCADAGADWRRMPALATHPRIAETAADAGWPRVLTTAPDPERVAAALATFDRAGP
jgi:uroporphyrinogen-III synthase